MVGEAAEIYLKLKELGKINPLLVWNVEVFIQYFLEALHDSISLMVVNEKAEG